MISIFFHTEPSAAPTDVKATSVSVSEILVAWKHIKESLGRPQGFEVWTEFLSLVISVGTKLLQTDDSVTLPQNYIPLKLYSMSRKVENAVYLERIMLPMS